MSAFDANSPEHNPPDPLNRPGRHIARVVDAFRMRTKTQQEAALVVKMEVLAGENKGQRVSRLFMVEGNGTRWFANLLRAVGKPAIEDVFSDPEVSMALTRDAFAISCAWGRVITDDTGAAKLDERNQKLRYMEVREVFPLSKDERNKIKSDPHLAFNEAGHLDPRVDAIVDAPEKPSGGDSSAEYDEHIPF